MMRMVRFDGTYLYRIDGYGVPEWMPKNQATYYPTSKMAHAMKRIAKRYYGQAANIVVVKVSNIDVATPQSTEGDPR